MRSIWILAVVVVLAVAIGFLALGGGDDADEAVVPREGGRGPGAGDASWPSDLSRNFDVPSPLAPGEEEVLALADEAEKKATRILGDLAKAQKARDRAAYDAALAALEKEAWEAPSARRFAVKLGLAQARRAERAQGAERMRMLDRARRLLSRGVWLPEYFDEDGPPNPERDRLVRKIQDLNLSVMTFEKRKGGGVPGVTRPYEVPAGEAPLSTVSRNQLPYGPNAILFWNKRNLDPRRVQAGEVLLLPEEALHVVVNQDRRRLAIFIGDAFVKDFRVGIGRPDKPTPTGSFTVGKKRSENPDWWGPNGFVPFGDPRNELGSMWIGIRSARVSEDAGFGIHGTNNPETVGTRCSNGCIRLDDAYATELYRWVRGKDRRGGEPTLIEILPLS